MPPTAFDRARHIKEAITQIRREFAARDLDSLLAYPVHWAGYKYLLLVISEASRGLPLEWKALHGPGIDWGGMAAIGNMLRHAYHEVNVDLLWSVYVHDLDPLEAAVDRMLAANPRPLSPS